MTRADLITILMNTELEEHRNLTREQARVMVDEIFVAIREALRNGEVVSLPVGTLGVCEQKRPGSLRTESLQAQQILPASLIPVRGLTFAALRRIWCGIAAQVTFVNRCDRDTATHGSACNTSLSQVSSTRCRGEHAMGQPIRSKFVRRHNHDGSHDSICTECVSMVASVENQGELSSHELVHICDPINIYRVNQGGFLPSPKSGLKTGRTLGDS